MCSEKPLLVIITGLSGAGSSTAMNSLEDSGFYCIDNLPIEMIWSAVDLIESGDKYSGIGFALGMDVRDSAFAKDFPEIKKKLSKRVRLDVVFLTADNTTLATRYSTTRRRHPLLKTEGALLQAVSSEKELLEPVENAADIIFDTSDMSPHVLARTVEDRYEKDLPERTLSVTITSFGYKYGTHSPAESLLDVRFLANPFFVQKLKKKTGLDDEVKNFVFSDDRAKVTLKKIKELCLYLIPHYYTEGKHYFRLGIGCSGGRHRSVCFAETLASELRAGAKENVSISVVHRDIEK